MSAITSIEKNNSVASLKALVKSVFPTLHWRHHGIGLLQGYVVEDTEPEVRVHVWAQELVKPGMTDSGNIHDHRFDLVSHVLHGVIGHDIINPVLDENGTWSLLQLTHARAAKESGYHGPTTPIPGLYSIHQESMMIPAGRTYYFPAGRFHKSTVIGDVTITCVEKHNQSDASARILFPKDTPPVMAFGHEIDWALIGPVLQRAYSAL